MGIKYVDEHLGCECYAGEKKPPLEIVHNSKGTSDDIIYECNCVLLLLEGQVEIFVNAKEKKNVNRGEFFFVPTGILLSYYVIKDSKTLIIRTRNSLNLCQSFHVEDLFKEAKTNKATFHSYKFKTLKMDEHLWDYANVMDKLLSDKLKCINLLTIKIEEFMILLRAYYTKEELYDLFYFMLNPNSVFIEFVQMNWRKHKTVGELASAMYISPQYFSKQFKKIFRKAPGEWMQEKKRNCFCWKYKLVRKLFRRSQMNMDSLPNLILIVFAKKCFTPRRMHYVKCIELRLKILIKRLYVTE